MTANKKFPCKVSTSNNKPSLFDVEHFIRNHFQTADNILKSLKKMTNLSLTFQLREVSENRCLV